MPRSDAAPIMIVAGEASGDLHGATLCRALRVLAPGRRLVGMGGERMAAAGVERARRRDRGGGHPAGRRRSARSPRFYRAWRRLTAVLLGASRPAVVVVIDFPSSICGWPAWPGAPASRWCTSSRPRCGRGARGGSARSAAGCRACWRCCPFEVALYEAAGVPGGVRRPSGARRRRRRALAPRRRASRLGLPPDVTVAGAAAGQPRPGDRAHPSGAARGGGSHRRITSRRSRHPRAGAVGGSRARRAAGAPARRR